MKNIIDMQNINKSFFVGKPNEIHVLKDVGIQVKKGEFLSIVGESGSGKSTLMNIIGALDVSDTGTYLLDDTDISKEKDTSLSKIRNKKIGFVFQSFNLIPRSTALKNVELPMIYGKVPKRERLQKAKHLLKLVGMEDRMDHMPNELSGGQMQRVAIARALANNPAIILADEPTGALDSETGEKVIEIFRKLNEEDAKTIVLITHNPEIAETTDRIISIKDGKITSDRVAAKNNFSKEEYAQ